MESPAPTDTMRKLFCLPTIDAAIAINEGNPAQAVRDLEATMPYELGGPLGFPYLYPAWVRGQAYLALHNGAAAAMEFQKVIDHRGIVLNEPMGALARLYLGRAYAMAGETEKAKKAYGDFFEIWNQADGEIPILMEARREFAGLR